MDYLAHIREDGATQPVAEHCRGTARLASEFADAFDSGAPAELAGLYHDIGKYSAEFQRHIRGDSAHVDHSTAGAQEMRRLGRLELAFAIAGHHGGLPDGGNSLDGPDSPTLFGRFQKKIPNYTDWCTQMTDLPALPSARQWGGDLFAQSFYIRMLYSCLVDADFLDTEAFMRENPPARGASASLSSLLEKVREKAKTWLAAPSEGVNAARNRILSACIRQGAQEPPGLFTLTVPTGGGKTFSSLAFALEHAVKWGMKRIIYVVPYTSIIDQTVEVYRSILGEENVLAHYAGAERPGEDGEELTAEQRRLLLASENWDAPVVVTTAVQFFESLYANRPAKCRKLHNIAGSVVVFDEAQTLPAGFLRPCAAAIGELVRRYRVSAVLCTATQPALEEVFEEFVPEYPLREICREEADLYEKLKRTEVRPAGELSLEALEERLRSAEQVLCVVNRRKTAQDLYRSLPEEGRFCLTTLLPPHLRKEQLRRIRARLRDGLPCRAVSTSLIEAGVDVDFPTVYREEAGLDSILQTAGRCNREGRRPREESVAWVFSLEDSPPPQMVAQARDICSGTFRKFPEEPDSPQAIRSYFQDLWYAKGREALDQKGILQGISRGIEGKMFPFRQVAERFRLIESPTRTVYVPVEEGEALCDRLRRGFVSRGLFRRLGEFAVAIYPEHFNALCAAGALEVLADGTAILADLSRFDPAIGLSMDVEGGQVFFN